MIQRALFLICWISSVCAYGEPVANMGALDLSAKSVAELKVKARNGDTEACRELGAHYFISMGDWVGAGQWYRRLADQNDRDGIYMYGCALMKQEKYAEAEKWLIKALGGGHPYAKSMLVELRTQQKKRTQAAE